MTQSGGPDAAKLAGCEGNQSIVAFQRKCQLETVPIGTGFRIRQCAYDIAQRRQFSAIGSA